MLSLKLIRSKRKTHQKKTMKNWMKMEKLLLKNQRYSKMKTRRIILKLVQKKTTLKSKMKKKRMLKLHKTRLMMHS